MTNSTIAKIMDGRASISTGIASSRPCANPMINCNAASKIIGRLSIRLCTMVMTALHCCWNQRRKCLADALHQRHHNLNGASISNGRFSISVFTMVISASITTGDKFRQHGKYGVQHLRKQVNHGIKSVGRSSPTVASRAFRAVGSAAIMFSITGVMLVSTSWNASTTLLQSISVSASRITETYDKVIDGSLHGVQRTLNGVFRLCCRCTRHTHALLNHMDGRNHIGIGTDIILNTGNRLVHRQADVPFQSWCRRNRVSSCPALYSSAWQNPWVCVLDESDIRTHLIGVIRHIRNGLYPHTLLPPRYLLRGKKYREAEKDERPWTYSRLPTCPPSYRRCLHIPAV